MAVSYECKLKFSELKTKRNYRFIIFKIENQEVVVEKVGSPDETYEDFNESLPADECRYAVYDFDFITDENCQKSKIFFIAWKFLLFLKLSLYACLKTNDFPLVCIVIEVENIVNLLISTQKTLLLLF